MKRLLGLTFVASLVMALASTTAASASPPGGFVVGGFDGGFAGGNNNNISVSAHIAGNGQIVGHVNETIPSGNGGAFQGRAEVVCLEISGADAGIGLVVTKSGGDLPEGFSFVMGVHDSGLPGGEGDTFAFYGFSAFDCASGVLAPKPNAIETGNIQVHDGAA